MNYGVRMLANLASGPHARLIVTLKGLCHSKGACLGMWGFCTALLNGVDSLTPEQVVAPERYSWGSGQSHLGA